MAKSIQTFREKVVYLRDDGRSKFPDQFGNEIYYTRNCHSPRFEPGEVSYMSNISIKYVFSGQETYLINKNKKEAKAGQMLFVNDKSDVSLLSSKGNSTSIFLDADLVTDCFNSMCYNSNALSYDTDNKEFFFDDAVFSSEDEFIRLKKAIDTNPDLIIPVDYYYELADSLLSSQLRVKREIDKVSSLKESTRIEIYRRLNFAKSYLHDTIRERFDLNMLSREASMSKFHLIRHFKEVFGLTPHRYFIVEKLKKASHLLKHSSMHIKDIAHSLGYPDSSSFGKQYRQIYGVSAAAYRNSQKHAIFDPSPFTMIS